MKCASIIGLAFGIVYAMSIPNEKCLFYYTFDETTISGTQLKDQSGNQFDISCSTTPKLTNDRFSKLKCAVSMDGSFYFSKPITAAQLSTMVAGDWTMGIMLQTKAPSGSMSNRLDIMGVGDPYNQGFFLTLNNNRVRIFLGNHSYYDSPDTLNDGIWHLTTVVFSQGTVRLFVDGVLVDRGAYTDNILSTGLPIVIGKHGTKSESFYKGNLDDAFFYNKALSDNEVLNLYRVLSGISFNLVAPSDTFSIPMKPVFKWNSVKNIITYAIEIDTNALFPNPLLSAPIEDTAYTVPNMLSQGTYYVRIGANFDDKTSFLWINPHKFIIK